MSQPGAPRQRTHMARHNDYGGMAEQLAAGWLERAGWRILERNWRCGRREIDIVARRGRLIAFVEVRARSSTEYGHPLYTITHRKRLDLERAALGWILRHGRGGEEYRFDVVSLVGRAETGAPPLVLEHVPDAWRPAGW